MKKQTKKKSVSLKPKELDLLSKASIKAAKASGKVLRHYYERFAKNPLNVREKIGAGLVTNADLEAEHAAVKILQAATPTFGYLTEEGTVDPGDKSARWILDPLDGTTNFVHNFPMFCVSLALEIQGRIEIGVIYHPILDELYFASRGKGAFINNERMQVSKTTRPEDALLSTGFTYAGRKNNVISEEMHAFEELTRVARAIRRPGSAALDLAYTARGVFDGFWERGLSPWDVAAGSLIVEEAGGRVTDFLGKPYRLDAPGILATNGKLHREILDCLK